MIRRDMGKEKVYHTVDVSRSKGWHYASKV